MKKHILFINPPVISINECQTEWYAFSHPTSILKLIAYQKNIGNDVSYIDCMEYGFANNTQTYYKDLPLGTSNLSIMTKSYIMGKPLPWLKNKLLQIKNPDEIWISCHLTFNSELAHMTIQTVQEIFANTPIFFGGNYPTLFPEDASKTGARVHKGILNEANLFFPDYSLFNTQIEYMVFQLFMGCENNCTHCINHKLLNKIIAFDIDNVVSDIKLKNKTYGTTKFVNIDPNVASQNLEGFLEKIINSQLDIELFFFGGIQPDFVTEKLVSLMKRANVKSITLPRELNNELNNTLQKKYCSQSFYNAIQLFEKHGFNLNEFHCPFPIGLKYDSLINILSIIEEIKKIGAIAEISPISFIPGSIEYERHLELLEGKNLEELNWALWPTIDSIEQIKVYSTIYNMAHNNRFNKPWEIIEK